MSELTAWVEGIGLLGPGLSDWAAGRAILRGETPFAAQPTVLPTPESLPPAERRRTGRIVKLALAAGLEATARAGVSPVHLPTVFASSGGDGQNCHEICQMLASAERQLSPTRFHNSVHNVAAGYWSIANGARAASNVVCGYDASFAIGLLEALTQVCVDRTSCLLIAYDSQYPEPLFAKRPIPDAFAIALLLSAQPRPASIARLQVALIDGQPDHMADPGLEHLRVSIPAARGLTLLEAIARGDTGHTVIEYLQPTQLWIEVAPCT